MEIHLTNDELVNLFTEDVTQPDLAIAIDTIHRLTVICATIGPDDIEQRILPLLPTFIKIPNDEILASIARQLANILCMLGENNAKQESITTILSHLQTLCCEEEIIVREQAVGSLQRIISKLSPEKTASLVVPVLNTLVSHEWFAARYSAAYIIPVTLQALTNGAPIPQILPQAATEDSDPIQAAIRQVRAAFVLLSADETPMVRRAAGLNLGQFAKCFGEAVVTCDPMQILHNFSVDDRDAIRAIAASQSITFVSIANPNAFVPHLFPIIEGLSDDCSWAPRRAIASSTATLCALLPPQTVALYVLPLILRAAFDSIQEVRLVASQSVVPLVKAIPSLLPNNVEKPTTAEENVLSNVIYIVEKLSRDPSAAVKTEIATAIGSIAPIVGRECATKVLVPIFLSLLAEENAQVRATTLGSLEGLARTVGPQTLANNLLHNVCQTMIDKSWRVRRACVQIFNVLANILGVKLFEKRVLEFIPFAFKDPNQSPRQTMCEEAVHLTRIFGVKWAQEKLVPIALDLVHNGSNFVARVTLMTLIEKIAPEVPGDIVTRCFLPSINDALKDVVPNVIISACKCVQGIASQFPASILTSLSDTLIKVGENEDDDVKYFACKANEHIKSVLQNLDDTNQ